MKFSLNLLLGLSFLSSISALSQEGIRKLAERALQNSWTEGGGSWQQDPPQSQQPFTLVELAGQIDGSIMAYRVNPNDPRVGADTISIVYQIPTLAWAAIGFSPNGGNMVGSEAVIAIPETNQILKYSLGGKSLQGVQPMPANQQTLVEKGMIQEQGTTTFAFTKIMNEPGEVPIVTNDLNIFLGAWGNSNALGIHAVRQPFSIDLGNGNVELVVPPIAQAPPPAVDGDDGDAVDAAPPAAAGEPIALSGQLDGSEVSITVNAADPNAGGQDSITVQYTIPALAWAAIAFNDNGGSMIGSEAVIGVPATGEVLKYQLNGKNNAAVVPFGDAQQTLIDATVTQDEAAGTTTLTFTKIMAEAGEIEILNDANTFLGAWGFSNELGIHSVREAFELDLLNLADGAGDVENARKISFWRAHGLIAGIAWGVLSPLAIGASVVRQLFKGPLWFKIHRGVNMLVVLSTVVAFILAVVAINLETPEGFKAEHFPKEPPHRMVGLVIFIIALLQALLGIFRPHATEPGEKKTTIRFAWEIAHKFLGYACFGMAIYQVQSGIKIYSNIFGEADTALYVFWTVIAIIIGSVLCGVVAIKFFGYGAKDDDDVKKSTQSSGSDKESTENDAKEQPAV